MISDPIPCGGTCGGNVYAPWLWWIDGKAYCGDCALEKLEKEGV